MIRSARFAAMILSLTPLLNAADTPDKLLGRWRSLETSKGGIGAMLDFHADGTVDFSPGGIVESQYRIEGNALIMKTADQSINRMTWELVSENSLHLKPAAGKAGQPAFVELTREATRQSADEPLTGEWIEKRSMAGQNLQAHWIFRSPDKLLFLLPFTTQPGHYTVTGDSIRLSLPNRPLLEGKFRIDGEVLKLPARQTPDTPYARY